MNKTVEELEKVIFGSKHLCGGTIKVGDYFKDSPAKVIKYSPLLFSIQEPVESSSNKATIETRITPSTITTRYREEVDETPLIVTVSFPFNISYFPYIINHNYKMSLYPEYGDLEGIKELDKSAFTYFREYTNLVFTTFFK